MRGLFFKIFVIFWIAQSLIFIISTALIVQHRFPRPDFLMDSLFSSLQNQGRERVDAFEAGGCVPLKAYVATHGQSIAITDEAGSNICPGMPELASGKGDATRFPDHIVGRQVEQHYVWSVPVISATNKRYVFMFAPPRLAPPHAALPHGPDGHDPLPDLLHFAFPQLPVAIAVGGATTFVLVLLFTRPLVKLRKAARELARGNLRTRVSEPVSQSRFFRGDEFQALVHDFNHMAERLESLVGAQQLLLRDVSHELRSPLARLNVALELAREDADPDTEVETHLDRIERETERLSKLIGQLLTLSSMEAMNEVNDFEPVVLNETIHQMIPDAVYEAQQRQCTVSFYPEAECVILGNRELLYRAVENVLRNAIRYTEENSEVEIRLDAVTEGNGSVAVIEISDRGPGIPERELRSIFQPFYRVDRARSAETGGFGVGLAIAERAVKLHHGEMRALNRAGGGTTVRMSFPLIERGDTCKTIHVLASRNN
jgi:two-component system sensor histidine kinase CpxA